MTDQRYGGWEAEDVVGFTLSELSAFAKKGTNFNWRIVSDLIAKIEELGRVQLGMRKEFAEIEQVAGKALGYPWFKDDQKNFPGATEENGVCVGEHVPGTIVQELAEKLATLERLGVEMRDKLAEFGAFRSVAAWDAAVPPKETK